MLTDKQIDSLLSPIINNERKITVLVLKQFGKLIKDIGKFTQADLKDWSKRSKMASELNSLENQFDEMNKLQVTLIKNTLLEIAEDTYYDTEYLYRFRKLDFPNFQKNREIAKLVDNEINDILDYCFVILMAENLLIRDLSTPNVNKLMPLNDCYRSVQQECLQVKQNSFLDYDKALERTITQLGNSGLRVLNQNGYTQEIDVAMRGVLLEGVKNIQQKINDEVGTQVNSNGKEISVHIDSAPDHEPVQGHQFTDEEFVALQSAQPFRDIVGFSFSAIQRPIGAWNCRHYTYAIIIGVTKPKYTLEELEMIKEENAKGIILQNGKHLSKYECTQEQRKLERRIRAYKKQQIVAVAANNKKLATQIQGKINSVSQEYVDFSNYCGIYPEFDRTEVPGFIPLRLADYTY